MDQNEVWRAHDEEASVFLDISIREMAVEEQGCLADIDDTFIVDSILILSFSGNQFNYTVKSIPSYEKSYTPEVSEEADAADGSTELIHPDQVTYLAFAENQTVGRIVLKKNWNHYALVEMIQVDKAFRRHGVGRQLMEQAKHWALEQGLPGIMLETQSINVSDCRFYESIGFVIGGFDKYVYRGIPKVCEEVAVYWYLHFK